MSIYDGILGSPLANQETKEPVFYDTGSYSLNALISGSIYGGIPDNRVLALAGVEAVGKTFFAMATALNFLKNNPNSILIYIDTEFAIEKYEFEKRGFPMDRVHLIRVKTVEDFSHTVSEIIKIKRTNKDTKTMVVLDSFGNLSTNKELEEIAKNSGTKDMTRAQLIRGAFRSFTSDLGELGIPLILTNHVYQVIGGSYFPTKEMSGGGGLKYAASITLFLSKTMEKDSSNDVTGAQIKCVSAKSRFTKEKLLVTTLLSHSRGLDRYYGLVDIALDMGLFKKQGKKIITADGTEHYRSHIEKNPKKYFPKEVLDQIDAWTIENFRYNSFTDSETDEELEND